MWDDEEEEEEEGEEEGTARQGMRSSQHDFDVVEEEEEEQEEQDEGDETNSALLDTTGYGDEDDGGSSDGEGRSGHGVAEDGDAGAGPEEESEEFKRHTYRPKPGQDIYGRTVGAGPDGAAPAMYVPPHLRAAAAAAAGASSTAADKFSGSSKRTEVQVMFALRLGIVEYCIRTIDSPRSSMALFGVGLAAQTGAAGQLV